MMGQAAGSKYERRKQKRWNQTKKIVQKCFILTRIELAGEDTALNGYDRMKQKNLFHMALMGQFTAWLY